MNIKIGMNMLLWGLDITSQHIPVFEMLKHAGYDGVEIPMLGQSAAQLKAMAAACDDLGLARTAAAFVGEEVNPISPDPSIRAAAIDNLKKAVDDANLIGADIIVGGIYQAHKYFTGKAPTEAEWQWAVECLRASGEYAQANGVCFGLEFLNRFEVFLVNTAADCKRMVEQIGLDNVGVHYDTHHSNIEDPAVRQTLECIGDCVNHVHLSESHRGTLGTGQVDWEANFSGLKEINYSGWVVIEAFGRNDPDLAVAANVWRKKFLSPEQLARDGLRFIHHHLDDEEVNKHYKNTEVNLS